jgi:hypothetical protein
MNAVPPTSFDTGATGAPREPGCADERWAALTEAARLVAELAEIPPEPVGEDSAAFPLRLSRAEPWRREHAERGVADLSAIMEPGIAALLAVSGRGADPRPAARALWREFAAARAAILTLLPPATMMERATVAE